MNHRAGLRAEGLGLALLLVAAPAFSQGRISNAKTETRSAAQGLDREVRAAAARSGVTWIGYRMPMVAGPRQMCCFDTISDSSFSGGMCRLESGGGISMNSGDLRDRNGSRVTLEPATEFLVLARLENGGVSRVRTFTPDCDVDAAAMPLVWLNDVKPDESVSWLASLVTAAGQRRACNDALMRTRRSARSRCTTSRQLIARWRGSSRRRARSGCAPKRHSGSATRAATPVRGYSRG
jgi:hypothetical protein